MLDRKFLTIETTAVLLISNFVSATVIATDPDQFGILAGTSVSTGKNVKINGLIGGVGSVSLGQNAQINNDIYTCGTVDVGIQSTITGRMVSSGNVTIGHHSNTGSIDSLADITIDMNGNVSGNLTANGNITINKNSSILGDIQYNGKYSLGKKATVSGKVIYGNADADLWNSTLISSPTQWTTGATDLYYAHNSIHSLIPGSYASLSTSSNATIYLSAGVYNFSSVWLGQGSKLIVDTSDGAVIMNVAGDFSTSSSVAIGGQDKGHFIIRSKGNIGMGTANIGYGSFQSLEGELTLSGSSNITGSVYASKSVWIGDNSSLKYQNFSSTVPEPATIAILFPAVIAFMVRRRQP